MSDYSSLKATINANVKANNNHEITGSIMNSVLTAMVNSLGAGYQYIGVATPTNPGSAQTPDYKCFYLATTPGTYTNLGGLVVADGEVAILKYDSSWTKEVTGAATADQVSQLGQQVIYDVTANNADAKFASLSALLSSENLSTLIPIAVRCGGMSIRFVQSSDNNYVQYRLMTDSFSTTPSDWQGVDDEPVDDSNNLVESGGVALYVDKVTGAKTFYGIQSGSSYYTTSVYINLKENDKIYIEVEEPVGAYSREVELLYGTTWTPYAFAVEYLEAKEFTLPQDAEAIRFVIGGGTDTKIKFSFSGIKESLEKDIITNEEKLEHIIGLDNSSMSFTAPQGGSTNVVYKKLYKGDVVKIVTNANVRNYSLYYEQAWHIYYGSGVPEKFTIEHDAERIMFYVWGADAVITASIVGLNQTVDKLQQYVDLVPGESYTLSKDTSGADYVDTYGSEMPINIIAGLKYKLTMVSGKAFNQVELFDNSDNSWVTVSSTYYTVGMTIEFIPPISTDRFRVRLYDEGTVVVYTDSYTSMLKKYIEDVNLGIGYNKITTPIVPSDFYDISDLCTKLNTLFKGAYSTLCKCNNNCMAEMYPSIALNENGIETLYEIINHNFRKDVVKVGMTFERLAYNVNKALQEPVNRFNDAILNLTDSPQFSLSTGFQADEPSAIVSPDGEKLYIYAHLKRVETTDGINWSEPTNLVLSGTGEYPDYIMHCGVNYIDGVYYLIGCRPANYPHDNVGGNLHLFTSSDGLNFVHQGILFKEGFAFNTNYTVKSWGNPYLIKEYGSGKMYLYIEIHPNGEGKDWENCVVKYTDILQPNTSSDPIIDGTIGDADLTGIDNPILTFDNNGYGTYKTGGNVDFAKMADNRPIKSEGKYYCYYHGQWVGSIRAGSCIFRASSEDLVTWKTDGICFNNRDIPTAGQYVSGNADHCVIEWKGRTYLFYTWDINDFPRPAYIKYTVDDRPFCELLRLRP